MHEAETPQSKKFWFWLSISINLGFLGFFKYYNFFITSFQESLFHLGINTHIWVLQIVLPVGISFYTFHGLSYVIDIYKDRIEPVRDFVEYSVFVSFFPLLVAGPIERATHLLPQIQRKRTFDYDKAVDGIKQILWGLFKKVVIADGCAEYANMTFNHSSDYGGSSLVMGALFFAFQIYGDFSGYSDIALGTAKLFGIDLLRNFAFPYFSRDIAEFWRRWHISLSSWFKDYLYIPLGGSKGGLWMRLRNTFIIFIVSGFWHGANWTFIAWGLLNAIYFIPSLLRNTNRNHIEIVAKGKSLPSLTDIWNMSVTFTMVVFAWIFFRAESVAEAFDYINGIFSPSIVAFPQFPGRVVAIVVLLVFFMAVEWLGREEQYALARLGSGHSRWMRWSFYSGILFLIGMYASTEETNFIYFQF